MELVSGVFFFTFVLLFPSLLSNVFLSIFVFFGKKKTTRSIKEILKKNPNVCPLEKNTQNSFLQWDYCPKVC